MRRNADVTHPDFAAQLDAYLDGELATADARELEVHLAQCPECTRFRDGRLELRAAITARVPALPAPDTLRARVRAALQRAAGATLADDVLASHIRSLMPGHLTDVPASDQHTVKPWFNGRLDFSPPVYDFSGRGYPLLGGRLDYVAGRAVAAVVYGRRQHLINELVWPATRDPAAAPSTLTRQGYHLLHWTTADYSYWVVSDLGLPELRDFTRLLQQADSATSPPK